MILPDYLIQRQPDTAKWDYGHGLLVAGAYGRMGCALLVARAALRTGAGLITAHVPIRGVDILQTALPEAMVSVDANEHILTTLPANTSRYSAIAIGPGIGRHRDTQEALLHLLQNAPERQPLILDADALTILSERPDALDALRRCTAILTPHTREMARFGIEPETFVERHGVTLILKGHTTAIYSPEGGKTLITTGNAGMATAGSGDVLTGILLGLATQNSVYPSHLPLNTHQLAQLAVQIHGIAGQIYAKKHPMCSLIAGDLIENLPDAIAMLSAE